MNEHSGELRVEVPDEPRGSSLVRRLDKSELTGSNEDGWVVVASVNGDFPQALTCVQQWLGDESIDQIVVHLGDRAHTMTRE
jgi:hypothetical protein